MYLCGLSWRCKGVYTHRPFNRQVIRWKKCLVWRESRACISGTTCRNLYASSWSRSQRWRLLSFGSDWKSDFEIWFGRTWACMCLSRTKTQIGTVHTIGSRWSYRWSRRSEKDEIPIWGSSTCSHSHRTGNAHALLHGSNTKPSELCRSWRESLLGSNHEGGVQFPHWEPKLGLGFASML